MVSEFSSFSLCRCVLFQLQELIHWGDDRLCAIILRAERKGAKIQSIYNHYPLIINRVSHQHHFQSPFYIPAYHPPIKVCQPTKEGRNLIGFNRYLSEEEGVGETETMNMYPILLGRTELDNNMG